MDSQGHIPHMFPDDPLADLEELNSADGWLRATSPSGVAAYEGVQMWQGTAGGATWDPEPSQEQRDAKSDG